MCVQSVWNVCATDCQDFQTRDRDLQIERWHQRLDHSDRRKKAKIKATKNERAEQHDKYLATNKDMREIIKKQTAKISKLETEVSELNADINAWTTSGMPSSALRGVEAAKLKEIDALTKFIEEKMTRICEISVKVAEMGNELEDTKEDLEESKKVFAELDVNYENMKKEWAAYQKMQADVYWCVLMCPDMY